jgi:hypothetical protein
MLIFKKQTCLSDKKKKRLKVKNCKDWDRAVFLAKEKGKGRAKTN